MIGAVDSTARRYHYRNIRVDGRVRRVYLGRGPEAEKVVREIAERKQQAARRRLERQQEIARFAIIDHEVQDLISLAATLLRVQLVAAGYRYRRGEYRRFDMDVELKSTPAKSRRAEAKRQLAEAAARAERDSGSTATSRRVPEPFRPRTVCDETLFGSQTGRKIPGADAKPDVGPSQHAPNNTYAEGFEALVHRAGKGDEACMARVKEIMDARPELWDHFADCGLNAESKWISLLAAGHKVIEEAIRRRVAKRKAELTSPDPSPLEKMLCDHVVVTWLAVQHAEREAAEIGGNVDIANLRHRRADSASKRYERAMKLLRTTHQFLPQTKSSTTSDAASPSPPNCSQS